MRSLVNIAYFVCVLTLTSCTTTSTIVDVVSQDLNSFSKNSSDLFKNNLHTIAVGDIDFKADTGVFSYTKMGNYGRGDSKSAYEYDYEMRVPVYEDENDVYIIYNGKEGDPHAYGVKSKKVNVLKRIGSCLSSKEIALGNNLVPVKQTTFFAAEKCKVIKDVAGKINCETNNNFYRAFSTKHQYYFTRDFVPDRKGGRIEYIDYSGFIDKERKVTIEDIVFTIENWKKLPELRTKNTFEGYLEAYNISRKMEDILKANEIAINSNEKLLIEETLVQTINPEQIFNVELIESRENDLTQTSQVGLARSVKAATRDYFRKVRVTKKENSGLDLNLGKYEIKIKGYLYCDYTPRIKSKEEDFVVNTSSIILSKDNNFSSSTDIVFNAIPLYGKAHDIFSGALAKLLTSKKNTFDVPFKLNETVFRYEIEKVEAKR